MRRVHTLHSSEIEAQGAERMRSLVEIQLKSGQVLSREATTSRGQPDSPMSQAEMSGKFTDCATPTLSTNAIAQALDAIYRVEQMGSVNELIGVLTG